MADVLYDAKFVLYMIGINLGVILRQCCNSKTSIAKGYWQRGSRGVSQYFLSFKDVVQTIMIIALSTFRYST